ncbi:hypothetical protein [Mucilaginibacter paludis]|uniref:Uncharacterized protein n=1 Tax=Mucilaginibacter paludis DSM 18603 TaxID=714943 RepID=H1YEU9_9SPHI|nr:hypothetical protein [Mucilaginibacter paludis]EHQ24366.1 hypothetical protein Mucpa_0166 [Mucilaginibacter paludis DSM 18603]
MKTYQTTINPSVHHLSQVISELLPAKFNSKVNRDHLIQVIENGNAIEIGLAAPYEEYLYKVEVDGNNVRISKSEHYTDDVNSLAMEDVLTDIVIAFIGKEHIVSIEPSTN